MNGIRAFAVDLDRTLLPPGGRIGRVGREALREVRRLGLPIIIVTGRTLPSAKAAGVGWGEAEALVAENGALVVRRGDRRARVVGEAVGREVRARLAPVALRGLELGRVVVSVRRGDAPRLRGPLRGLPVEFVPNAGRMMVLPAEITKASGLRWAMRLLHLGGGGYAAIGDGENDIPMLRAAALSGVVANAPPSVRRAADFVAGFPVARGVVEFVDGPLSARVAELDDA